MTPANGTAEIRRSPRHARIEQALRYDFGRLFGLPPAQVHPEASFTALGADSLFLLRASRAVQDRYGVRVPFRRLLSETNTVRLLAALLDGELPPDDLPAASVAAPAPAAQPLAQPVAMPAMAAVPGDGALQRVLAQQLQLMSLQLEALGGAPVAQALAAVPAAQPAPEPVQLAAPIAAEADDETDDEVALDAVRQAHVDALAQRMAARTPGSHRAAEADRVRLATPAGPRFRLPWKAVCHPLQLGRGEGGRVWDVDGNEYVDFSVGGGSLLFGHTPAFVTQAVADAAAAGLLAGERTPLAGEVAELVRELTGAERVCFADSRTEAVMGALRLARAVTERPRVALFAGADHGSFDGVLARRLGLGGSASALPAHLGVPRGMLQDVLVLEPGAEALETIRARGAELAAVLVDPSGAAGTAEFLQALSRVCVDAGAALVFDETHTGFRVHPGGAQGLHGVRADLAVYGGVPGSGLAMGIIAGRASYLDAADGGKWSARDGSFPLAPTTRVHGLAGENPTALAAASAALRHLKSEGPALLDALHARAAALADTLNGIFDRRGAPLRATASGPDLRIRVPAAMRAVEGELLPIHLREQGVHARDGLRFHLCTAHTEADLAHAAGAVEAAVAAMQADSMLGGAPSAEIAALPLSAAQRDLWLLCQLSDEASRSCNEPMLLRLRGAFDHGAMAAALRGLVAHHPSLRTVFTEDGDLQRVHPHVDVDLPLVDLAGDGAEERLAAKLDEAVRTPFDLTRLPILRAAAYRMRADDHVVALVFHHLLTDGWSNGLLLGDLRALYEAERAGRPAALPAAGSAGAEPAGLESTALAEFWAERLAGHEPGLDLPTDRPRPAVQDYAGGLERQRLEPELYDALQRLAEANGATLFGVLLAAFQLFLHRLARQDDVVVGAIFAGQHAQGTADTVGCWVDVLPVRSRMRGAPTFAQQLAGARAELMDAIEHRGASLGDLVALLGAPRDPTRPPLVSAVLNMHSASDERLAFADAEAEVLTVHHGGAKFELDVTAVDTGGGLRLDWEYRSGLFDRETIVRWMDSFRALLRSAAAAPNASVHELEMLADAERTELARDFQGPRRDYPLHRTIGAMFEEQAARTPERTAIVHDGEAVSYAELDRRAGLLARRLADRGVGPGRFVGVMDERGIGFITAVVAVLKAGGAYVPIDPAYPEDRVRHMLRDSGVEHLVTRRALAGDFAEALADAPALRHVVCLDESATWDADGAGPLHGRAGDPRDPAYMLYTSGSTGLPKGAVIRHDGAVNHIWAQAELLGLDERLAFLQSAPSSSDISVWQMLAPLVMGGRTVVVNPDTVSDPARLLAVLRGDAITLAELVPAVLRALLEHAAGLAEEARALPALEWMMATGEEVPVDLANAWLAAYPAVGLTNAYGPTEASDDVTQLALRAPLPVDGRSLSIGSPLPNVDCHVVDGAMRRVPVGVPGELCVGGIAVGDGYHGKPGRTAASFVPDPFASQPGRTMYRTGDLARWRPDGTLEFLGRIDGQVKVRGFRIELGEVEAALRGHPAVRDCAAVVRDAPTGRQLAAFLVPTESAPAVAELRGWLRERLPEHMVPAVLVPVDALPLTPAGKVDRRALAADPRGGEAAADLYVAPRTPTEKALCGIWAEVLGVERVGVESDFFALGGHSLLAAMVATRVRAALGASLPLRRLFEYTTVALLAAHLDAAPAPAAPARPALGRVERSGRRMQAASDGFLKSVQEPLQEIHE